MLHDRVQRFAPALVNPEDEVLYSTTTVSERASRVSVASAATRAIRAQSPVVRTTRNRASPLIIRS